MAGGPQRTDGGAPGAAGPLVTRRRPAAIPPADAFAVVAAGGADLVWLDSAIGEAGRGRRSVLCLELEPAVRVEAGAALARLVDGAGRPSETTIGDLWASADAALARESAEAGAGLGWVGYVAYEAGWLADRGLPRATGDVPFPVVRFDRVRAALVDRGGRFELVATGADAAKADARLDAWEARLARPATLLAAEPLRVRAGLDGDRYRAAVATIREQIAEGRVYQACYTAPVRFARPASLAPHYARLRAVSPGDFGGYLRMGDLEAASTSPERFVRVDGRIVECRPMKGTRPRHSDQGADVEAARELAGSVKDRAENVMIVDLVRNDIGRVCEVGGVRVPALYEVESYATVHQMTSTVRGTLRPGVGPFGVLEAAFPPGSMTGAPKIAACHLLRALEAGPRGLYSGTIGWLGYDGVAELSVVIRTLQAWGDEARWNVGGGIVWDSTPDGELDEARAKAAALERSGLLGDNAVI